MDQAGYGPYISLLLLCFEAILTVWLIRGEIHNSNRVKPYGAASASIVILIAFFWMGNRIIEIVSPFGSLKAQAVQDLQDIRSIKASVDQARDAVNAVASKAQEAESLSKALQSKNDQAEQQLAKITDQLHAATLSNNVLKDAAHFALTVLSAQSNDRWAFDQLTAWSKDTSYQFSSQAEESTRAIQDSLDRAMMFTRSLNWKPGVDPQKLDFGYFQNLYYSSQVANPPADISVKDSLITYIASRNDFTKKEKLKFLITVLQTDSSLRAVAFAGFYFDRIATLNFKTLDVVSFSDWWKQNQSKLS